MSSKRVLIVEDEETLASALKQACERCGWQAMVCFSGSSARRYFLRESADLVVLDIGLPDMNGLDFFTELREQDVDVPVLIITAHGNLENAVRSRKLGAAEYLVKPFALDELTAAARRLLHEGEQGAESVAKHVEETLMIGAAPSMQQVYTQVAHACLSDVPVLITGATGTGKTLCARAVHMNSERRVQPFVNLHCSTLPEELIESELFGHEKSAFTGAQHTREGHVARAEGGTLLLDEIADIPLATQAKLLRFVEDRVYNRVGGRREMHVDLRLVAATNRDLKTEVRQGRFREDLYYRLKVLEIALPPLKERREDLPALCAYFLGRQGERRGMYISERTWDILNAFDWPGNVRQLKNTIERAAAVCPGRRIDPMHLPADLFCEADEAGDEQQFSQAVRHWINRQWDRGITYDRLHNALERVLLGQLLARYDNKPTVMANDLNINRATLLKKRRRMELD